MNRVVQNPMSLKLQVFKTHNRGWGIRCLNDIPQGTFICIYAGTLHREQTANEVNVIGNSGCLEKVLPTFNKIVLQQK